jgi:large subunit ribosomal protein L24
MTGQIKFKVKKGDTVQILAGKNKGARGQILEVRKDDGRVVVQGVNMVKRHQKATQTTQGGIVAKEASIHVSNVALIDPKSDKPTKVGYKTDKDGTKTRVARKSGATIG